MKLSQSAINGVKRSIISDLFDRTKNEIEERKAGIVDRNRSVLLSPYKDMLEQLPPALVPKHNMAQVQVNIDDYQYTWSKHYDKPIVNFCKFGSNYYDFGAERQPLHESFFDEAREIINDERVYAQEKTEMESYLDKVFSTYTGPKQLRNVLPEALHKYLPEYNPKPRKPRATTPKQQKAEVGAAPDVLNIKLTENLLEG